MKNLIIKIFLIQEDYICCEEDIGIWFRYNYEIMYIWDVELCKDSKIVDMILVVNLRLINLFLKIKEQFGIIMKFVNWL
jgi:hypothetical protein